MKEIRPLNFNWGYRPSCADEQCLRDGNCDGFEVVDLPHTNKVLAYNYFDEKEYQFVSCYKKNIDIPVQAQNKEVVLLFEGVMVSCKVWCNGSLVGEHRGGYTPFSVSLTQAVTPGESAVIVVEVDSTEQPDVPPFGGVVDYLTYGGIYREVQLCITDSLQIQRLWVSCPAPLAAEKELLCDVEITAAHVQEVAVQVQLLCANGDEVATQTMLVCVQEGTARYPVCLKGLQNIALWGLDTPVLYHIVATITSEGVVDTCETRFGFRKAVFTNDGFFLNDECVKLVGLNRHQSYPYVGYAMPERPQRKDAIIIKEELACNIVRTSHYPQSKHFLDACDELGLLVMEELPGWQHIGGEAWKNQAVIDMQDMIVRDFNRPSIILWGVRINESQDDHDFYAKTNEVARAMDPTRQTGGTRYIQRSEFLEDVYTYNDFTHNGGACVFRPQQESTGLDHFVPTLVTESNGHMYPTKRFDQEARSVEHALRHLRVINEAMGREDIVGGISWCAFDYNTHASFGSGDKICYHGVCDMFRNPKYAGYSYAAQRDCAKGWVLEPITVASRGEQDGGGGVPFYVLTNCDYIKVYKNGAFVDAFYPDKKSFAHLPHPPIQVSHLMEDDMGLAFSPEDKIAFKEFMVGVITQGGLIAMKPEQIGYLMSFAQRYELPIKEFIGKVIRSAGGWGEQENELVIEGWCEDSCCITHTISEKKFAAGITAEADDTVLICNGDTYDATRITVRAVDNLNHIMPFTHECVEVVVDGEGALMGPNKFPVCGGVISFWVRTTGKAGVINVTVNGMQSSAVCAITAVEK